MDEMGIIEIIWIILLIVVALFIVLGALFLMFVTLKELWSVFTEK